MPWRRFILAVACGTLLVSAFLFLLGPRIFILTQELASDLLLSPHGLYAFLVNVPALVICTVPGVVVTALIARHRSRDAECRCRKCGYILRGISEPRCPECGERI